MLRGDEIDVSLEPDAIKAAGTMSGSGGVIVMDDSVCVVRVLARIARFYAEADELRAVENTTALEQERAYAEQNGTLLLYT